MDKSKEYEDILVSLSAAMSQAAENLLKLREELVPFLEHELNYPNTTVSTPTEILRSYVQSSKNIQKYLFESVYTHVLTIERLADHILCKRAVALRAKPKAATSILAPTTATKYVETDLVKRFQNATAGMSVSEVEEYLKRLRGE